MGGPGMRSSTAGVNSAPNISSVNVAIDPVKVIRRHLRLFIITGVVGVVLGVGSFVLLRRFAPRYTAIAQFEYIAQIRSADDVGDTGANDEIERFMSTQAHILTQDEVLQLALTDPRILNDTDWVKPFLKNGKLNVDKALLELKDIVHARPLPDTAFVELRVVANTPKDAANIANSIQSVYIRQQVNKTQSFANDAVEAMSRQQNTLQEERKALLDRMAKLMRDNSIESWDERLDTLTMRLQALNPKYVELGENIALLSKQLSQYEDQLNAPGGATYPQAVHDEVDADPIIISLRQDIAQSEAALKSSRRRFGDNHRLVLRIQHDIQAKGDQLASEREQLLAERFEQKVEESRASLEILQKAADVMLTSIEELQEKKQEIARLREDYFTMKAESEKLAKQGEDYGNRIADEHARNERTASTRIRNSVQAPTPQEPSFPRIKIVAPGVTILVVGLVAGVVFLRELLEQRVRGPADLKTISRARALGVIPDMNEDLANPEHFELASLDQASGTIAESIRQLRATMVKACEQARHKTILFVSGMPGSGSTSIITNLASSLALAERRTLIIDANFRRARMHEVFGLPATPGLGEVLADDVSLEDGVHATDSPGLDVLPAGAEQTRVSERLTTNAVSRVLSQAREVYDIVLIDVAPAMISSDAFALANRCDAVVLVIRAMGEKRGLIARLLNQFNETDAQSLGVVVNRVVSSAGGYLKANYRVLHEYQNGSTAPVADASAQSAPARVNGEASKAGRSLQRASRKRASSARDGDHAEPRDFDR